MFEVVKKNEEAAASLNITSLMDVLTIILIFLVFNFSTEEQELTPPKHFALPTSSSERQAKLSVRVTVAPDQVLVEDKPVARVVGGEIARGDLDRRGLIPALTRELQRERIRREATSSTASEKDDDEDPRDVVYLEAADGLSYGLVDVVLKSAAAAGYAKFRVAVMRE